MQPAPPETRETSPSKRVSGKTLVIVGCTCVAALLTMGYIGFRGLGRHRFANGSLITEAHMNVAMLGRGIAECAEKPGAPKSVKREVPPTTPFVPATLAEARQGYASTAQDWSPEAFSCAKFTITVPQRFQYRWEATGPGRGLVEAQADLDGDGAPEVFLHVGVTCAEVAGAYKCEIGSVEPLPWTSRSDAGSGS